MLSSGQESQKQYKVFADISLPKSLIEPDVTSGSVEFRPFRCQNASRLEAIASRIMWDLCGMRQIHDFMAYDRARTASVSTVLDFFFTWTKWRAE